MSGYVVPVVKPAPTVVPPVTNTAVASAAVAAAAVATSAVNAPASLLAGGSARFTKFPTAWEYCGP
jgi:hypothetical protein